MELSKRVALSTIIGQFLLMLLAVSDNTLSILGLILKTVLAAITSAIPAIAAINVFFLFAFLKSFCSDIGSIIFIIKVRIQKLSFLINGAKLIYFLSFATIPNFFL